MLDRRSLFKSLAAALFAPLIPGRKQGEVAELPRFGDPYPYPSGVWLTVREWRLIENTVDNHSAIGIDLPLTT